MVSYQGNAPIANNLYGVANATTSSAPFITVFMTRDPTSNDINYPIKQRWINTNESREWILTGFTSVNSQTTANWLQLSDGDALTQIGVPNGTSPITPDANGLINFTSNAGSVTVTGSAGGLGNQNINFDISNYQTNLWTPNLQINGSSTGIVSNNSGGFTQIANLVFFWVNILLSSKGSSVGSVTINNFPVPTSTHGFLQSIPIVSFNNVTVAGYTTLGIQFGASSTIGGFLVSSVTGSGAIVLTNSDITDSFNCFFNGFYIVD